MTGTVTQNDSSSTTAVKVPRTPVVLLTSYVVLLLIGLLMIELRIQPLWLGGRMIERAPSLVAIFNWAFHPDQMQYVAASDLKMNHRIGRDDITFHPLVDRSLYQYLPKAENFVGKYLKDGVCAGKPILPGNLSPSPRVLPDSQSFIVGVRLAKPGEGLKSLEAGSKIELAVRQHETLEGTVVSGSFDTAAPGPSCTTSPRASATSTPGSTSQTAPPANPSGTATSSPPATNPLPESPIPQNSLNKSPECNRTGASTPRTGCQHP